MNDAEAQSEAAFIRMLNQDPRFAKVKMPRPLTKAENDALVAQAIARNPGLKKQDDALKAKCLAAQDKAKETGEDQLLRDWFGEVDDGEGGVCLGTTGCFVRPNGTTYNKVTMRAY